MAVALDASSPASVYATTSLTTLTTASFTPPAGSILVVSAGAGDGGMTFSTPTATGQTFTSRASAGTTNASARAQLWTATATGSAITVSLTVAGAGHGHGLTVSVFTGAQLAATPATATFDSNNGGANSAPTLNLTTVAANSIVAWALGDWSAINGSTRTYRSSAAERGYTFETGEWTYYAAYQAAATAGVQTFGLTAPTGQKPTMVGIEIQQSGAATPTRYRRIGNRR